MSHTEPQARELWCPLVRGTAADHPTKCLCIASKCAMWQWVPSDEPPIYAGDEVVDRPNGCKEIRAKYKPAPPTHGFCGLAGRPEVAA